MTLVGKSIETLRTPGGRLVKLSDETVGSIGLQLVDRLETLHSVGFAHLDAYPNNLAVGIGAEGLKELFLIDFGEARSITGDRRLADIQSLSHSVLQLLVPGTPYGDFKHYQDSGISIDEMCRGLPEPVFKLFKYSHITLGFSDNIDYQFIRNLLKKITPNYSGILIW